MNHASLFSGLGGFDLAAQWMGWNNLLHCEKNEFCQKILKQYWPNAELFTDITESSFLRYRGLIDIVTGGFPCQPWSNAGKRKGKADDRHLWPQMLRAIREIQPRWVVGENVRGLTNWNGGMVFDEVQADLETEGYEVTPFLLPACSIQAPHRRDRIWFIAYCNSYGRKRVNSENEINANERGVNALNDINSIHSGNGFKIFNDTNANDIRQEGGIIETVSQEQTESWKLPRGNKRWRDGWPVSSPVVCGVDDGIPNGMERIAAIGNAVVPQLVYQIFKAIEKYESLTSKQKLI